MKRVGALISPLLKGLGLEEAVRLERIKKEWAAIFREPLSLHTFPSGLNNGELLIAVDSPVWLQQLSLFKADLMKKLRPFEVKEVRFRIGRVKTGKKDADETPQQKKSSCNGAALQQIEETVSEIEDGPVKESIRRAMEKSFAHRPRHGETEKGRYGE